MNFWTMIIYGSAAVIAVQGLIALMTAHRQASVRRLFEEEVRRREWEASLKSIKSEPEPAKAGQKPKAA